MRKFILINSLLLFLFGCKNEANVIKCKGIPDVNQSFSYMYFKTENEGYLFGTYTEYEELSKKALENPNNIPKSTNEANIYKTIDGGLNWSKIDSINDYRFHDNYFINKSSIFIKAIDSKEALRNNLVKFDISTNKSTRLNFNFERMGNIWSNDIEIFVNSKNSGINTIYSITPDFDNVYSIAVQETFKDKVINFRNDFYTLTWDNDLYNITKQKSRKLPINLQSIVKQDENNILIAGNTITDDDEISLLSYDVNTKKSKVIQKFKNYSIIRNLQSNDKAIIGFIGNIKGLFTEYDLLYSLDKGETWKIKKLKESNYVRPSCLINNIVYIYSGGARMQKIVLLDDDNNG